MEEYSPLEMSLFEQIGDLKKEQKRLQDKLGYAYSKAYTLAKSPQIYETGFVDIDAFKLFDCLEDCKQYYDNSKK